MTAVSQIIPTFIQGINDQPDELKKPGQVKDAVNVFPDVVFGMMKRPGLKFIDKMDIGSDGLGTFLSIYREELAGNKRQFLAHIGLNGNVRILDLDNNKLYTPEHVDGAKSYLEHSSRQLIKSLTINDTTLLVNPVKEVGTITSDDRRPYEAFIEIDNLIYNRDYKLYIDDLGTESSNKVTTATRIDLVEASGFGGDNANTSCPAAGSFVADLTEDDWTNRGESTRTPTGMRVRFTSIGTPAQTDGDEYRCNYRHEVDLLLGGSDYRKGDKFIYYPREGNDQRYEIKVREIRKTYTGAEMQVSAKTPADASQALSTDSLLAELKADIESKNFFETVQIIGNGIYVSDPNKRFNITTPEQDLFNILNNEQEDGNTNQPYVTVNSVDRLPVECKEGIVVKVENTFSTDDDYFVMFNSRYDLKDGDATGGQGYWDECAEPGGATILSSASMPHRIRFEASEDKFYVEPIEYDRRTVGTDDFNPSFVNKTINNMILFRNRLVFLSDENVIASRAGDVFNFFPKTALAVSDADPIDLSCATNYSSVLHSAVAINNGIVLFSPFQQFLMTTSGDIFSPNTCKITQISKFDFEQRSTPVMLGTNIAFLGGPASQSRFYEMTNIYDTGPVDVIERSKLVDRSFENGYYEVADSKEDGVLFFGKDDSNIVWGYRYFKESSQRDLQTAWFKWTLPGDYLFHFMVNNAYYNIADNDGEVIISKFDLANKEIEDSYDGGVYDTYTYLDWYSEDSDDVSHPDKIKFGRQFGVPINMRMLLPTFYPVRKESGSGSPSYIADTTSSLVIHRIKLNTASLGAFNVKIEREGKSDYDVLYEQTMQDAYLADKPAIRSEHEETIPIYERNTNVKITLHSNFPTPAVFYSLRWEGDYNSKYYRRV